jgi:TRAP transporter 4TM/12TM fusion protein
MPETLDAMDNIFADKRKIAISIIGICLTLFHMYTASVGILTGYLQTVIHWAFIGSVVLLDKPAKWRRGIILDLALIITTVYLCYYQAILQDRLIFKAGIFSTTDFIMSVVAIAVALISGRRAQGAILPIICIVFIIYANFGWHIPGMFKTVNFSFKRITTYLFSMTDGLYGSTLLVSAQYIFLFILFGKILDLIGAGAFFVDIAFALAGRMRGGPAQAAVFSSMLMGTISGSGVANVVTTGTFTIPLMKKTGYHPAIAGAVEAVASSGGQIMPPVMGAVAFLMSEMTGIPYSAIAIAALIPAILYYVTLSCSIYLTACKTNMSKNDPNELPNFFKTLRKNWYYIAPLAVIMYLIFTGHSAQRSVFYSILTALVIGIAFERKKLTPRRLLGVMRESAVGCAHIAPCCMLAGIIMGTINLTGLALKISAIIVSIANGQVIIALIVSMFVSLLLGMGLPTSAAYVVLAVLVAPPIISMGVSTLAANLFIVYFGALSTITPPVALSAFAASAISGAGVWETGYESMKLSAAGFIIPFIFCFNEELLLNGELNMIIFAITTAVMGCVLLSISLTAWFSYELTLPARIILFVCAVFICMVDIRGNLVAMAIAAVTLLFSILYGKNKKLKSHSQEIR